ncbi:MAG: histidine phosphatase family protein [Candidatus Caldarchaeum sp.]
MAQSWEKFAPGRYNSAVLRLLLMRHGQTAWNAERKNQGQVDIPLDDIGVEQSRQLACAIASKSLTALFSSDLMRCVRTAEIVAEQAKTPVRMDPRLRERNYGDWEGKTPDEVLREDPDLLHAYRKDPTLVAPKNGETGLEVYCRTVSFLFDFLRTYQQGVFGIVAHGGTVATLLTALLGAPPSTSACFRIRNCSLTEFVIEPNGRRRLERFDDVQHLDPPPMDWSRVQPTTQE